MDIEIIIGVVILVLFFVQLTLWCVNISLRKRMITIGDGNTWLSAVLTGPLPLFGLVTNGVSVFDALRRTPSNG